jgi:hypothetical protein
MFQRSISSTVALGLMILSLGVPGCGRGNTDKITIQGGRSSSDGLSVSSGNLVVRAGKRGVLFGTANATNSPEQFSYIFVFKYAGLKPVPGDTYKAGNSSSGKKGASTCTLVENGQTIQADYEIELDDTGKVTKEQLKVGGKVVDLAAGRLFLIDLTSFSPIYEQKKSDQLGAIKSLDTTEDVEHVAASILDALK